MKRTSIAMLANLALGAFQPVQAQNDVAELERADAAYNDGPFADATFGRLKFGMRLKEAEALLASMPREERRRYTAYYGSEGLLNRIVYREPLAARTARQAMEEIIGRYGAPTQVNENAFRVDLRYTTHIVWPAIHERLVANCKAEAGRSASSQDVSTATSPGTFALRGGTFVLRICPRQYDRFLISMRARYAPNVMISIDEGPQTIVWTADYAWPANRQKYLQANGLPQVPRRSNPDAISLHGERANRAASLLR